MENKNTIPKWYVKLRRFLITNETAYKISTILRLKKIKNLLEKAHIYIGVDKEARKVYETKHNQPREFLDEFIFYIIDNCNLSCKNCSSFCPVAKEKFISVENFTKDMKRIAELTGGNVLRINLSGGEPLLHPDLLELLSIARSLFPKSKLRIGTNALLLSKKSDEFWKKIKETNTAFIITRYPIKIDWKTINKRSDEFDVGIEYQGLEIGKKTTHHMPLDMTGSLDPQKNFKRCAMANGCISFKDGKFYTCAAPAMIDIFNDYFNKNLGEGQENGIDIHKAKNIEEILNFLAKPIPFCRYCDMDRWTYNHEWGISKKEITEWT
jgi:MoaA/NifB/PqqE/SkfB family radical SAM enzyme